MFSDTIRVVDFRRARSSLLWASTVRSNYIGSAELSAIETVDYIDFQANKAEILTALYDVMRDVATANNIPFTPTYPIAGR